MKYILLISIILFLTSCTQAEEKQSVKEEQKQTMSNAEFLKEYMKLDEEVQEAKTELDDTKKLNQTLDKLSNTLGTNK